jgi:hypothetical protein
MRSAEREIASREAVAHRKGTTMRVRAVAVAASVMLSCSVCGCTTYEATARDRTANLRQGMTPSEVAKAVGLWPSSAQRTICGGHTGTPWICHIITFGGDAYLAAIFEDADGVWRLNAWAISRAG